MATKKTFLLTLRSCSCSSSKEKRRPSKGEPSGRDWTRAKRPRLRRRQRMRARHRQQRSSPALAAGEILAKAELARVVRAASCVVVCVYMYHCFTWICVLLAEVSNSDSESFKTVHRSNSTLFATHPIRCEAAAGIAMPIVSARARVPCPASSNSIPVSGARGKS